MIGKGETQKQRTDGLSQWNIYFAWFPIQMDTGEYVWLERYEAKRMGEESMHKWLYRLLSPTRF